jgi:COP9 signalosome complex subunit 4
MASQQVTDKLAELQAAPQQKVNGYTDLYNNILIGPPDHLAANLSAYLDTVLSATIGILTSRPVLEHFVSSFPVLPTDEIKKEVGTHLLTVLASKTSSFEEQDTIIRDNLATVYEGENDNSKAAEVLRGIQLESSQRQIAPEIKAKIWIRIIRNLLEEDDTTAAEQYLNRAKNVVHEITDPELRLHYDMSQARILDSQRKFLQANAKYHQISFNPVIADDDRMQCLSAAIVCAVLAPAGPQRSRALAQLYKDDRAPQLADFSILEKMYLDRLLSPAEVDAFAERLQPHQKAKTADGSTVLQKAVIEHNLLGASRLYNNIGVDELGALLGQDGEKAEEYAARMIEQGRLVGRIDQIDKLIFFDGGEGTGEKTSSGQADRVVGREIRKWDFNVQGLAEEVEKVTTMLQNKFPEFVAQNMVL